MKRIKCKKCSKEALETTIQETGGLCMFCFKHPKQAKQRLEERKLTVLEIARSQNLQTQIIFLKLSERTYYPVEAVKEHDMCFRILDENEDPEHCHWPFECNDIVECIWHYFSENDEPDLVATKKCKEG